MVMMIEPKDDRLFTLAELRVRWGTTRPTIRGIIRSGQLPVVRLTGRRALRIRLSDILAYEQLYREPGSVSRGGQRKRRDA